MRLIADDDKIILFLNRLYIRSFDFDDKEATEKFMRSLLVKVSKKYDIKFDGYYVVNLYVDFNYGIVALVVKEELEYLDYFVNQIEVSTKVFEDNFLYEVSDLNDVFFDRFVVYRAGDKLYLKLKGSLSDFEMGRLIEFSNIVYGEDAKLIVEKSEIVR